ncbi:radical SAM protein [Lederbergia ruris]|uniref:radical SAM protein n=1 Tax=Lederbergia ruris TaxID=217495 RepID=UPI0039A300B0
MPIKSLYLELTSLCNLKCPYCFNYSNELPVKAHKFDDLVKIVKQAKQINPIEEVVFSGGEAILHPSWRNIVEFVKSLDLDVSLITNGIGITPAIVDFLIAHNVKVALSLGGTNKEEDAPLRGLKAWERSIKGLNLLSESGIKPGVIYIIHKENLLSEKRAVDFLTKFDLSWVRFVFVRKIGRASENWDRIGLTLTDKFSFLNSFSKVENNSNIDVSVVPDPDLESLSIFEGSTQLLEDENTEVCLKYNGLVTFNDKEWGSWDDFYKDHYLKI